ncbi:MAG: sulfotransferase [Novosphingobium sp.]|nr:sulfotransferase [Novosphingobium sp.]
MTPEEIVAAARARTGLEDFGDPAILEGLGILLKSYAEEAKFTETGMARSIEAVVAALANRMRVEDWLKRHPELLERPIEKPLFVFGLPRTGTTLAINLLHADPARRSFLRWEAFDSVPPPRPEELHGGPRYDAMQAQTELALKYAPQIAAIHYEDADSPTECQFAMAPSFCAQVYDSQADIPSYHRWFLHDADYGPAFRYEKRLLQLLQAQAPGRWTLKNPWHPLFLDALTAVFPEAQLVMTHRDPAEVVGSACNLLKVVRLLYSDDVDLIAIGDNLVETFEVMIARSEAFRARHGQDAIFDVQYADVMRDPIGTVRSIYGRFDEPFTSEAEAAMKGYLAANPKGKHGRHEYTLEEFGLTRDGVHRKFAEYIERYRIPVKV